jgi:hypothetical protein
MRAFIGGCTDSRRCPQIEREWRMAVPQRDCSVIFMIFVAPQSEFAKFQPTYQAMLKSAQIQ